MAEIEHVSELLSFATMIMHSYYTVFFLSLLFFLKKKEHFASSVMVK